MVVLRDIWKIVAPAARMFLGRSPSRLNPQALPWTDKLKKIRLIIFDVDGVLTDGRITFGSGQIEIKSFNVRDGHGIKIAKRCGLDIAFVTGRSSEVVSRRAQDLGIERVYQGMWDKRPPWPNSCRNSNLASDQVAVVGDDVVDIPLMRRVGVSFTVPEAPENVRREVQVITRNNGVAGSKGNRGNDPQGPG